MCSNFYGIWNLVQMEHAYYEYSTWNHSYKKRKDSTETRAVLPIILLELEISGVAIMNTLKQQKRVAFVRNCSVNMTLKLF